MQSFPALSVCGLGKRFGDRAAFENVSFEIGYGEVFGFLGPNGAGKTHNRADARHPHRPDLRLGHGRRNPAHTGERDAINAHSVVATDIRRARSSAPDSAIWPPRNWLSRLALHLWRDCRTTNDHADPRISMYKSNARYSAESGFVSHAGHACG